MIELRRGKGREGMGGKMYLSVWWESIGVKRGEGRVENGKKLN